MATVVNATCSECFLMQQIELNPRRRELACEYCSHSVPMFEGPDMHAITAAVGQERTKTFIALGLFAGSLALFGMFVFWNTSDDFVNIEGTDYRGHLIQIDRQNSWIVLENPDTGEESPQLFYKNILAAQIEQVKQKHPLMTDDEAARRAGDLHVKAEPREARATPLLILAVLAALGAIVFSGIATSERLVCEF